MGFVDINSLKSGHCHIHCMKSLHFVFHGISANLTTITTISLLIVKYFIVSEDDKKNYTFQSCFIIKKNVHLMHRCSCNYKIVI